MKEITPQELMAWRQQGQAFQLIDVREPHEADEQRMGGTLIPLGEVVDRKDEVATDQPVVIHCRSGARSQTAIKALEAQGLPEMYNLKGGILAFAQAYPSEVQHG
jgi:sulfur-carrier protein adenylyltransferase/sulfurtransferase